MSMTQKNEYDFWEFPEKKADPVIFRKIVPIQYNLCDLAKTIVICTPERESARENNREATNNNRGSRAFVFVG